MLSTRWGLGGVEGGREGMYVMCVRAHTYVLKYVSDEGWIEVIF